MNKLIGILGGTFDPIHQGHLMIAEHVLKNFPVDHIEFIPSFLPPHRQLPIASAEDRLAMVRLAIQYQPQFIANDIEIKKNDISYSVDTFSILRKNRPNQPFALILGADAFYHLNEWHNWKKLLTLTHLIVINRNDIQLSTQKWISDLLKTHQITDKQDLLQTLAGKIYIESIQPIPISAENIRMRLKSGDKHIPELPKSVYEYILKHAFY